MRGPSLPPFTFPILLITCQLDLEHNLMKMDFKDIALYMLRGIPSATRISSSLHSDSQLDLKISHIHKTPRQKSPIPLRLH